MLCLTAKLFNRYLQFLVNLRVKQIYLAYILDTYIINNHHDHFKYQRFMLVIKSCGKHNRCWDITLQ
jgi:hypothetical protein